jgi:hypothetical protein
MSCTNLFVCLSLLFVTILVAVLEDSVVVECYDIVTGKEYLRHYGNLKWR